MSLYTFSPEKSFLARLYWSNQNTPVETFDQTRFQPIGVTVRQPSPSGLNGWLHADQDNVTAPEPKRYYTGRKFVHPFWFGCYDTEGEHDYEIRAAGTIKHRQWTFANHRLDISTNGYLGVYPTPDEPGHDALANGTMLWRCEGLPTQGLAEGGRWAGLVFSSVHNKKIKRLRENDFPYLNENEGEEGWLALEVVKMGVAKP
ncbi:hypothetical protein [Pseudomonas sp. UBA6562]|uniref:hypothetical protein n=1 Tax=Pseudomonas sp. UBA6562 TaxID=1947332 RepID=UPI0025DA2DC2|nr:hypothetical protein [Pseudomonas sp. UBA6562]